jgi:FKBP-type peptidyl-prolyl cis-trans isomerase
MKQTHCWILLVAATVLGTAGCRKTEATSTATNEVPPPPAASEDAWKPDEIASLKTKFGALESTPSGLFYRILAPGSGSATPPRASLVTVHYVGTFLDGREFDSSRSRGRPFQFRPGLHQVIEGWDETLLAMRKGEKRLVVVPYWLGYGKSYHSVIPPRSTLVFEIELLDWEQTVGIPGSQSPG